MSYCFLYHLTLYSPMTTLVNIDSLSPLPSKGGWPTSMMNSIQPRLHTSDSSPWELRVTTSGLHQRGRRGRLCGNFVTEYVNEYIHE